MLQYCLFALAGAWCLQLGNQLPPGWLFGGVSTLAAVGLGFRWSRPAACFLLGACIVGFAARAVIEDRLPRAREGETVTAVGRVLEFTDTRANPVRLLLATQGDRSLPSRIRLSWYDAPEVPRIGETWTLQVRLRRPRGFSNPLRFDYEHWLFRQGIGATGYVVNGPENARLVHEAVAGMPALRQRLVDRTIAVLGRNSATAVLLAITVGATHEISRAEWDRYAATGTSHLMAISGMNIAMAAGGAYLLAWIVIAPFCRRVNVRDGAALVAVAAAIVYSEVSGFAIPVRRAMLMALLVLGAGLLRRQLRASRVLALTCIAIVTTDPLALHAPGFKLSFAAVAILMWVARHHGFLDAGATAQVAPRLVYGTWNVAALQLTLLFGLFPLTAILFGRTAWLAPLVNLLVLPLFNLVTVPAGLLGLLFDGPAAGFGDALLVVAWHSVRVLLWVVQAVAGWDAAHTHIACTAGVMLVVTCLPAIWAIVPPGFPGRRLAWIAAATVVLYKPAPPPPNCLDLTALDVGQGLSLVLQTHRRTLVYDTGPSFRSGSDTGALVLVPYLRSLGVSRVDLLAVSHGDNDHAGGAASLLEAIDVREIFAGEELQSLERRHRACRRGQAWTWDGVRFAFVHPGQGYAAASDNDRSCVLEIRTGEHALLLTGDIEAPAERHLLRTGVLSPADLVVIPHHGSRTSSTPAFVQALQPSVAIVSAGYDNRWGFPRPEVVARWEAAGARIVNTATSGATRYRICPDTGPVLQSETRKDRREYWHAR
ncbi:MAG TPA: DNA internalization-related competence protein ComEC/Rec2 [Woeseiaceae bacterium]|nr:DNA internalization-related competence protein ComEC/Rec2 [Woeseiaceae bacterium]